MPTLTVNDGSVQSPNVPVGNFNSIFMGDLSKKKTRSQFIIPATELTSMVGRHIGKMTFYAQHQNVSWGSASFDVYLAEVDETSFSSPNTYYSWDTLNKVYSGSLSVSGGAMVITFSNEYTYTGKNLLVGINQTNPGEANTVYWYGVSSSSNTALYSIYDNSGDREIIYTASFLPKTTASNTLNVLPVRLTVALEPPFRRTA